MGRIGPVAGTIIAGLVVVGGSVGVPAMTVDQNRAELKVAILPFLSFAPFFVASEEDYFTDESLDVEFLRFKSSADAITALVQGDIDVAGGTTTSGFMNAVAHDLSVRAVADKGHIPAGGGYSALVLRKSLWDNREVTTMEDLAGRTIAEGSVGDASQYYLSLALRESGLTWGDIDTVYLDHPAMIQALDSGAIDAANMAEPLITKAEQLGVGVRFAPMLEVLPPRQIAVVFYGPTLLERHPEIGVRFMVAYLKAVRQYNQGKTERNLAILENWTGLDRSLLEACDWPHINRDGTILVESVRELRNWLFAEDYLDAMVPIDRMVDFHYARLAGEMLAGPKNTP